MFGSWEERRGRVIKMLEMRVTTGLVDVLVARQKKKKKKDKESRRPVFLQARSVFSRMRQNAFIGQKALNH